MIDLFNINNHIVDTSKFSNFLHSKEVEEVEDKIKEYVGAKYACSFNSASNIIYACLKYLNPCFSSPFSVSIPSLIPPVVLNSIHNSGNIIKFNDDISWVGDSYLLHNFGQFKIIDSAQRLDKDQFANEANPNDLMFFSFYPTKPCGGMDGGIIVSNDESKILFLREISNNGFDKSSGSSWSKNIKYSGYKMYMNSFQAKIILENFKKYEDKKEKIRVIREKYNQALGFRNSSTHLYRIQTYNNKKFLKDMADNGISCGIHYDCMHDKFLYNKGVKFNCHRSTRESYTTASIPLNESMTNNQIQKVIDLTLKLKELNLNTECYDIGAL